MSEYIAFASAVIVALIGGTVTMLTKKADVGKPDWESFTQALEKRVSSLEEQVEEVRTELKEVTSKYWSAINHVRDLRRGHPAPPAIPQRIAEDI